MSNKKTIVIFDDEVKVTNLFVDRHGKIYDIKAFNDKDEFKVELNKMYHAGEKPDLILTDMGRHNKEAPEDIKEALYKKVKDIIDEIMVVNYACKTTFIRSGIDLLKEIKKDYPEFPVALYTGSGYTLATKEERMEVSRLKGDWIQKKNSYEYEAEMLEILLNK